MKSNILPITILILASLALIMGNSEVLALAESRNPVATSPEVWADLMSQPMGLLAWLGCWLTQIFHSEWLGALMLSAIWAASFALLCRRFALSGWRTIWAALPIIGLIGSITCLGYWIYCTKMIGYFVANSLGLLSSAAMLLAARRHSAIGIIAALLLYPLMGFWAVAMGLAISLCQISEHKPGALATAISTAASPWIWYAVCYHKFLDINRIYSAGLPLMENEGISDAWMLSPLLLAVASLALCGILAKACSRAWMAYTAVSLALAAVIWTSDHGYSFDKEIRMTCAAQDGDWEKVIHVANGSRLHTETMRILYELALTQSNTLGSQAFGTRHQEAENPECSAIKVTPLYIANHVIHYYYGRYNLSIRWCMELGTKYGFGISLLRQLAMSHNGNGETRACQKYRTIIGKSLYYSDWRMPEISPVTNDFHSALHDILESERRCYEYHKYQTSLPQNIGNQTCAETAMYHAMRDRNKAIFNDIISHDSLFTRPLGTHFQEACAIFCDSVSPYVSPEVNVRCQDFQNSIQQLRESNNKDMIPSIYQQFGQTYWWYVYFEK